MSVFKLYYLFPNEKETQNPNPDNYRDKNQNNIKYFKGKMIKTKNIK